MSRIVVSHDAGFFSCCTVILRSVLAFYDQHPGELPDVDSSGCWGAFKDSPGDVTHVFFDRSTTSDPLAERIVYHYGEGEDQFSDYSKVNHDHVGVIFRKYFMPSSRVVREAGRIVKKYYIDLDNTIAVLYRGTDKHLETNVPTYDEMRAEIDSVRDGSRMLIQSDEAEFCQYAKELYPEAFTIDETRKVCRFGGPVHHSVPQGSRVDQAVTFLAVMLVISGCRKIVLNSGNVGMWACLMRGKRGGIHQYLCPIGTSNSQWFRS